MSTTGTPIASLRPKLFKNAMKGDWEKVTQIYDNEPTAPNLSITKSGDTALHLAVSNCNEVYVEKMVKAIQKYGSEEALGHDNDRGHTALHFAAAIGNVPMCKCIASADPSLIGKRNQKGETPLFSAVLYGHKEAFWCLHDLSSPQQVESYFRRSEDGQHILHCAIAAEDFEIAIEIIHEYKRLADVPDEEGNSPLHILANKPSCFRSGSNFGPWENILYDSIYANKPKIEQRNTNETTPKEERTSDSRPKINRSNTTAAIDFIKFLQHAVDKIVKAPGLAKRTENNDVEKSTDQANTDGEKTGAQEPPDGNAKKKATRIDKLEFSWINKTREQKEKHLLAVQLVDQLLNSSSIHYDIDYEYPGHYPGTLSEEYHLAFGQEKEVNPLETPSQNKERIILIAAKKGVAEIVDRILVQFPVAIYDADSERKNIILLAAENRHLEVCRQIFKRKNFLNNLVIDKVDYQRNTALHLAAMHKNSNKLWPIPGSALQMQSEIKWYKFVENIMPQKCFTLPNKHGKTPEEIFIESHKEMAEAGSKWLRETSTACSVVNTILATVVFTSCTTFPGGNNEENHGKPTLQNESTFNLFMDSSMVSFCFSVTSLVVFLAILTSRHQQQDFGTDLPRKLLLGLTSLFVSIAAMLSSFCSGHLSAREDRLKNAAVLLYALAFLPSSLFAISQLPLYIDLARATFWNPF